MGAADYLGVTQTTVNNRIKAGTFPKADSTDEYGEWWLVSSLDKYTKALARKKAKKPARRSTRSVSRGTKTV
jgi:hypothetical protein